MIQKTYTKSEFGRLIEKAYGKRLAGFRLLGPPNPLNPYRLWLEWRLDDGLPARSCVADDAGEVAKALRDPSVVSVDWHMRHDWREVDPPYVTIIRRGMPRTLRRGGLPS